MSKSSPSLCFYICMLLALFATDTRAAIVIQVAEKSGNVVFTYSGTVDLSATLGKESDVNQVLGFYYSSTFSGQRGGIASVGGLADKYSIDLIAFPLLGSERNESGGIIAGDYFLLEANGNSFTQIWVPDNYVSNTFFSGSVTFSNESFSSLGLEEGQYVWVWANGPNSDTATFNVGLIPEPTSAVLLTLGICAYAFMRRRQSVALSPKTD